MTQAPTDMCIAYFSRSGHSKRLANKLAAELRVEQIEIVDQAYAGHLLGYLRAGYDSLRQKSALRSQQNVSLSGFGHVILVGPVWTSFPAVPLRALLQSGDDLPQAVSLFLTSGGQSSPEKAFATAVTDLGRPLVATGFLPNSAEGTEDEVFTIARFLPELKEPEALKAAFVSIQKLNGARPTGASRGYPQQSVPAQIGRHSESAIQWQLLQRRKRQTLWPKDPSQSQLEHPLIPP
jgi:hypothetical protein